MSANFGIPVNAPYGDNLFSNRIIWFIDNEQNLIALFQVKENVFPLQHLMQNIKKWTKFQYIHRKIWKHRNKQKKELGQHKSRNFNKSHFRFPIPSKRQENIGLKTKETSQILKHVCTCHFMMFYKKVKALWKGL